MAPQDGHTSDPCHSVWSEDYEQGKWLTGDPWELQAQRQKAKSKRCERALEQAAAERLGSL